MNSINIKHSQILKGGQISLGTTQKLINLYWKMLWVFDDNIKCPIHCPCDRIVIKKLPKDVQKINWTTLNKMENYNRLVAGAKEMAKNSASIAEWELKQYDDAVYKDKAVV